jgi:hypothetical protein
MPRYKWTVVKPMKKLLQCLSLKEGEPPKIWRARVDGILKVESRERWQHDWDLHPKRRAEGKRDYPIVRPADWVYTPEDIKAMGLVCLSFFAS